MESNRASTFREKDDQTKKLMDKIPLQKMSKTNIKIYFIFEMTFLPSFVIIFAQ